MTDRDQPTRGGGHSSYDAAKSPTGGRRRLWEVPDGGPAMKRCRWIARDHGQRLVIELPQVVSPLHAGAPPAGGIAPHWSTNWCVVLLHDFFVTVPPAFSIAKSC